MNEQKKPSAKRSRVLDRETNQPKTSSTGISPRLAVEDTPSSNRLKVEDLPLGGAERGPDRIGETLDPAVRLHGNVPSAVIDGTLLAYFSLVATPEGRMDVKYQLKGSGSGVVGAFVDQVALRGNRIHFLAFLAKLARLRAGVRDTYPVRMICDDA